MKKLYLLIFLSLIVYSCNLPFGPKGAESPEHLLELCEKYHAKNDVGNMMRLYKKEGVSKDLIKGKKKTLKKYFDRNTISFGIIELDDKAKTFFNQTYEVQGQAIKYNLDLIGQITVSYEDSYQEAFLYGKEEDKYFFGLQVDLNLMK